MLDLKSNWAKVANHLAGRPVILRWQDPLDLLAASQAYRTPSGDAVIDINPSSSDKLKALCRECARIRLHFKNMRPVSLKALPGSRNPSPEVKAARRASIWEQQADAQAKKWLRYANNHFQDYAMQNGKYVSGRVEAQLLALLNMTFSEEEFIEKTISKAVERSVTKALIGKLAR